MRALVCLILVSLYTLPAVAQWQLQDSGTTASFRGVHAVSDSIAWVSGTNGTILHTTDGGAHWERCATPPGAEKLDFRGIWAWDANTAEVMSAGPGNQSRLYKTTDGCRSWTQELVNDQKDGFWDAIAYKRPARKGAELQPISGVLIGDPLNGSFDTRVNIWPRSGWNKPTHACEAREGEAAFAASNSSVYVFDSGWHILVTGGKGGPRALVSDGATDNCVVLAQCIASPLPLASGSDSAGAFSVSFRDAKHGVVVGGDYKKPNETSGTAAWTADGGKTWKAATKMPHGYRSSVAWNPHAKVWIAAGTNGTDISHDDGKTWAHLDDGEWNALSLPFVVGPNGRIAKLKPAAVKR